MIRRRKEAEGKEGKSTQDLVSDVEQGLTIETPFEASAPIRMDKLVSTGSTLLDLAISGKRVRGGGIPGGIFVEISGPPGSGKTGVLVEICASTKVRGGDYMFNDPEGRFDQEYAELIGLKIDEKKYKRPDTVKQLFNIIYHWEPEPKIEGTINSICGDSLAALSTKLEMEDDEGDKMGMKRAKEFSEGLRKTTRMIADNNWLFVASNQEREGTEGRIQTPGGQALKFYASLRMRVYPPMQGKYIKKEITLGSGVKVNKTLGIRSAFKILKNTVDDPFREGFISVLFGRGIDDVRENLLYIKEMTGEKTYWSGSSKGFASMEKAIAQIEDNNLEEDLKGMVISLWEDIERKFEIKRKKKEIR